MLHLHAPERVVDDDVALERARVQLLERRDQLVDAPVVEPAHRRDGGDRLGLDGVHLAARLDVARADERHAPVALLDHDYVVGRRQLEHQRVVARRRRKVVPPERLPEEIAEGAVAVVRPAERVGPPHRPDVPLPGVVVGHDERAVELLEHARRRPVDVVRERVAVVEELVEPARDRAPAGRLVEHQAAALAHERVGERARAKVVAEADEARALGVARDPEAVARRELVERPAGTEELLGESHVAPFGRTGEARPCGRTPLVDRETK